MKLFSSSKKYIKLFVFCFFILLTSALPTFSDAFEENAAGIPTEPEVKKLHITSDMLVSNQNELYITFKGNVKAVHGDTTLHSDQLKVYYAKNINDQLKSGEENIKKIIATGNVTIELNNGLAECDRAVYITEKKTITLTGENTRLQRDKNQITGKKITIYQDTGQIVIEGNADSPVNAVFQPENDAQYFNLK